MASLTFMEKKPHHSGKECDYSYGDNITSPFSQGRTKLTNKALKL